MPWGYSTHGVLWIVHKNLTEILRNNRNTKVKLILKIFMIYGKENITKEFAFHSNIEVNLEGTDEDDI